MHGSTSQSYSTASPCTFHRPLAIGRVIELYLTAFTGILLLTSCRAHDRLLNAELKLVQVVFRHGARNPVTETYCKNVEWLKDRECLDAFQPIALNLTLQNGTPALPLASDVQQLSSTWLGGCAKGELTTVGQIQAFQLGLWLRQQYAQEYSFLPSSYTEKVLSAMTTDFYITRESLQGVVTEPYFCAGLYGNASILHAVTANEKDEILLGTRYCRQLNNLYTLQLQRVVNAVLHEAKSDKELVRLHEDVCKALGLNSTEAWMLGSPSFVKYVDLYDELTIAKVHNKKWPAGITEDLYRRIGREAVRRYATFAGMVPGDELGPQILKLTIGHLLHHLVVNMEAAASGVSSAGPKLFLYSGHDATLISLLASLLGPGVPDWPVFTANLVFELWQKKGGCQCGNGFHVRIFYNQKPLLIANATSGNPEFILGNLSGSQLAYNAGSPLSLAQLKEEVWKPYILSRDQYTQECMTSMGQRSFAPSPAQEFQEGESFLPTYQTLLDKGEKLLGD